MNKLIATALLFSSIITTVFADSPGLPGGYSQVSINDANVAAAAQFAVQTMNKGTLERIVSAQVQVVAGTNYKMLLEIIDAGGNHHTYNVVVFVPLPVADQPMQLKSVEDTRDISNQLR